MRLKNNPFRMILIWIVFGAVIGSLIGALGVLRIIPKDTFESAVGITIRICIGLIVLILDLLCIWALLRPRLIGYIKQHGETAEGIIAYVHEIPRPDQLREDAWIRKARFVCTVLYHVNGKDYKVEYPPTPLTSRQAMYPFSFEPEKVIPVQYLRRFPQLSCIALPQIQAAEQAEQQRNRIVFIVIPLILTALYVTAMIMTG